jgi:hypothetical protein
LNSGPADAVPTALPIGLLREGMKIIIIIVIYTIFSLFKKTEMLLKK